MSVATFGPASTNALPPQITIHTGILTHWPSDRVKLFFRTTPRLSVLETESARDAFRAVNRSTGFSGRGGIDPRLQLQTNAKQAVQEVLAQHGGAAIQLITTDTVVMTEEEYQRLSTCWRESDFITRDSSHRNPWTIRE